MQNRVALMVKVWNEEFVLPYMLEYYETLGVDEIFIFDGGSFDRTHEILNEWQYGIDTRHVIRQEDVHAEYFKNTEEARLINEAIEYIEERGFDWIVKLDADEIFTKNIPNVIEMMKGGRIFINGYFLPRYNIIGNLKSIAHRNRDDGHIMFPDLQLRIFNVKRAKFRHPDVDGLDTMIQCNKPTTVLPSTVHGIIHLRYILEDAGKRVRTQRYVSVDEMPTSSHNFDRITITGKPEDFYPPSFLEWIDTFYTQS